MIDYWNFVVLCCPSECRAQLTIFTPKGTDPSTHLAEMMDGLQSGPGYGREDRGLCLC